MKQRVIFSDRDAATNLKQIKMKQITEPETHEDIPAEVKEAYIILQSLAVYYTDSQEPKIVQEERNRQAQLDKQAENEFYQVCEKAGYPYSVYTGIEFDEILQYWYNYERHGKTLTFEEGSMLAPEDEEALREQADQPLRDYKVGNKGK